MNLCAENMNPRVSFLFQTPEDLISLGETIPPISLCIELGHLWPSSLVPIFIINLVMRSRSEADPKPGE